LHSASLDLQRDLGNRRGEAVALNNLCVVARDQYDHPQVEQHGRASLAIAREIGDKNLEGLGLMHLGTALRGQNRMAEAEASFRQSYAIFDELGDPTSSGTLLNFLGNLALAASDWPQARRCFDEALALNQTLGNYWGLGISTCNLAALHCATGDDAAALPLLMQSLAHYRQAGVRHGLEECFELLAHIAQRQGRFEHAAWCWGVVAQLEQGIGKQLRPDLVDKREQSLGTLASLMTAVPFQSAQAAGRQAPLEDALRAVLSEERRAF
jgi:tetratricopeptide (TPR) repeat protein